MIVRRVEALRKAIEPDTCRTSSVFKRQRKPPQRLFSMFYTAETGLGVRDQLTLDSMVLSCG